MQLFHPVEDITVLLARGNFAHRDQQVAAVRRLVETAVGPSVDIRHRDSGAPYLEGSELHVSISHCSQAVCVALSPLHPVGVDVQEWRDSLGRVAPRFLPEIENADAISSKAFLLTAWTYKEATYKLLQSYPDAPVAIPQIPLFHSGVRSFTYHFRDFTLTLAAPASCFVEEKT